MTTQEKVEAHLNILRNLRAPSGLFLAADPSVRTGYDKAWLRDNFYTALGFEAAGDMDTVKNVFRAILDLFLKHEDKIHWAVENKPHETWQYIHARYNPETFEEYWEEWGNKQNDAVGAVLFKVADLESRGFHLVEGDNDKRIIQKLVDYLNSVEYWHDPDNGVWEEWEEVHASSIGACVAGLQKLSALSYITVHPGMIEKGEEALAKLLPRESASKFADLALLSLIYPYALTDRNMENIILQNIEYHLVKERGVVRYKTDKYYNKNKDGWSEEAEWTMGFPWLSMVYSLRGEKEKAKKYLERCETVFAVDGKLPELYFSNTDKPNENIPLAWSEGMYIAALLELEK